MRAFEGGVKPTAGMRSEVRLALGPVILVLVLAGCVSSIEERSTARGGLGLSFGSRAPDDSVATSGEASAPPCVMEVPGTGIAVRDVDGGIAVDFATTAPDAVDDLRRAVRRLGASLESGSHEDHSSHHSARALELASQFHAQAGALPRVVTSVRDVPGGARLVVRAADPAQRALVRERMRAEIGIMQRGVCPLLGL
ncbi:MAG TPA: hypothetical protein VIL20_25965 [Sandaracinaceae bacterium]